MRLPLAKAFHTAYCRQAHSSPGPELIGLGKLSDEGQPTPRTPQKCSPESQASRSHARRRTGSIGDREGIGVLRRWPQSCRVRRRTEHPAPRRVRAFRAGNIRSRAAQALPVDNGSTGYLRDRRKRSLGSKQVSFSVEDIREQRAATALFPFPEWPTWSAQEPPLGF